jgi:hypothetical protein
MGASQGALDAVAASKAEAVAAMAGLGGGNQPQASKVTETEQTASPSAQPVTTEIPPSGVPPDMFQVGEIVVLKSNPALSLPVVEILPGSGERRYRVFQNGAKATYYESQLQALGNVGDERQLIPADELRARLTSLQIRLVSKNHGQIHGVQAGVLSCDTRRFP